MHCLKKHRMTYPATTTSKTTSLRRRCQRKKYLHSPKKPRNLKYLRKKIDPTRKKGPNSLKSLSPSQRNMRYPKRKRGEEVGGA